MLARQKQAARSASLGDIPVHEIQAGNGEGQVPLRKLSRTIMKLPRTLTARR